MAMNLMGMVKVLAAIICIFFGGCATGVKFPDDQFCILLEENSSEPRGHWSVNVVMPESKVAIRACARPVLCDADFEYAQALNTAMGVGIVIKIKHSAAIELFKLSIRCDDQKLLLLRNGTPIGMSQGISGALQDDLLLIFLENEFGVNEVVDRMNSAIKCYAKMKRE